MPSEIEIETAEFMNKLFRKGNWNNVYDRREHFKRFQNLSVIIKDLVKRGWMILHKKPKFEAYSLNTKFKMEIIDFMERNKPELKGTFR